MTDTTDQEKLRKSPHAILRYLAVSACLFLLIALYALKVYLSSPAAASRLSHLVASRLHHPFTIESLELSLQGITMKGVILGTPSGFPPRNMVKIDSVVLSPRWTEILRGRRSFALVSLDKPRIDLHRDSSGRWNFEPLRNRFATGKQGPGLAIARLAISNGTVAVNDRKVNAISLQLINIETKGTTDANLMLTFEDEAHDRFRLEGTVRPGKEPSYTLRLTAPRITLAAIPELIGKKPSFPLSGTGSLLLNTAMNNSEVTADMRFSANNVPVDIVGRKLPLSGSVAIRGTYDRKLDQARIEKADISVDDLVRFHASGTLNRLKSQREFSIVAGIDQMDIARIAGLLPENMRKGLAVTGTIESSGFMISGSGRKVTAASGAIALRDGSVSSGAETILRGVSGELAISPASAGFSAAVAVRQKETTVKDIFQGLAVKGTLLIDRRLKPLSATIHSISGKVTGIGFSGNASFIPGASTPVSAVLNIPETDLSAINHLPALRNAAIEGGRGSLALELKGSGIRKATGTVKVHVSKLLGMAGEKRFSIVNGTVVSGFAINGRKLNASGTADFRSASYGRSSMDGAFEYAYADRNVTIDHARFATHDATVTVERISARMPQKQLSTDAARYPLSLEFAGGTIHKGKAAIAGLSGKLLAAYAPGTPTDATFTLSSRDISLLTKEGKQILTGGTAKASGSIAGDKLTLDHAVIGAGEGIALDIRGSMNNFAAPEREGRFTSHFGKTDINLLLDRFANSLPRLLQEATASGSIAADAEMVLKAGKPHMNGEIVVDRLTLGVESQKLAIGMIDGAIPVSYAPSAAQPGLREHRPDFTRNKFPFLVEKLGKSASEKHSLTIDGMSFGPLQIGKTKLMLRSDKGVTEVTSLRSSLYDGILLGKGYLTLGNGYAYGADLLMNDMSLTQLCNAFPKIKGYISGRVVGVFSLSGSSLGKEGPVGQTELWARETKEERMLVSREFLQRLANKNLSGFFFSDDRPYDKAEMSASLEKGYLEFYDFNITHTNFFGVRDLSVTVAESRNRIALEHLFNSIKNAATRGKSATVAPLAPEENPAGQPEPGFNWEE